MHLVVREPWLLQSREEYSQAKLGEEYELRRELREDFLQDANPKASTLLQTGENMEATQQHPLARESPSQKQPALQTLHLDFQNFLYIHTLTATKNIEVKATFGII